MGWNRAGQTPQRSLKQGMAELTDIAPTIPHNPQQALPRVHRPRPTTEKKIKARHDYIQGKGSVRVIAQMHSLCFETVQDWCNDENWFGLREQYEQRQLMKLLGPATPEPPKPPTPITIKDQQIQRLEQQLKDIEEQMVDTAKPSELQALANAHSKLFDTFATLTGIQRRSVQKPARNKRGYESAQPIEPDSPSPVPVQPMPAKPMGWEYD